MAQEKCKYNFEINREEQSKLYSLPNESRDFESILYFPELSSQNRSITGRANYTFSLCLFPKVSIIIVN